MEFGVYFNPPSPTAIEWIEPDEDAAVGDDAAILVVLVPVLEEP